VIAIGPRGHPLGLAVILTPVGLDASWLVRGPAILIGGAVIACPMRW
jgi:hypothetical protein